MPSEFAQGKCFVFLAGNGKNKNESILTSSNR